MGAPPIDTSRYSDITRPRIWSVALSCTVLLAIVIMTSDARPIGISSSRNVG